MNILLVLPVVRPKNVPTFISRHIQNHFCLGTYVFAKPITLPILAALTPKKHTVEIIEVEKEQHKYINFNKKYDLVAITSFTESAFLAYDIADEFRRRNIKVVLGGWHPSALPDEAKKHADSVVIGEAEETWPQLLIDLENGKLKPFYTPPRPVDPNIIPNPYNIYPKKPGLGIQATRGCPYGCDFCSITNMKFRNQFRSRPVKNVIEDIDLLPQKALFFNDNSLTINKKYSIELFKELRKLDKKFVAYGSIDALGKDDKFLQLAQEAGCSGWMIGFESVCQDSLRSVSKKTNKVKYYKSSIKKIQDYGMSVIGMFIFGFDHDDLTTFDKTYDFINESGIDIPYYHILTPYPGTKLFHRLENEGRITSYDWSRYNQLDVVFEPKNMTAEELLQKTKESYQKLYKTLNCTRRTIKSMNLDYNSFLEVAMFNIYLKFGFSFIKMNKKLLYR